MLAAKFARDEPAVEFPREILDMIENRLEMFEPADAGKVSQMKLVSGWVDKDLGDQEDVRIRTCDPPDLSLQLVQLPTKVIDGISGVIDRHGLSQIQPIFRGDLFAFQVRELEQVLIPSVWEEPRGLRGVQPREPQASHP